MLLSLNWLKDHLQKPDVKFDPKELSEKLTMRGLAVQSIQQPKGGLDGVIVGKIVKIEKHPNADRLQVTKVVVSAEADAEQLQIVCGAKNIAEGDLVPVAMIGAMLPGDLEIKQSSIRGVDSFGMLCSGKELGISGDHEGILGLPRHAHIGEPVARLLGHHTEEDTIFEFELTPNRGDCLSVIGLAREIAPLLRTKLKEPKPGRFRTSPHRTSSIIKVDIDSPEVCPRYVARVMDTLKVAESPDWMQARLKAVGIRPINNIVDVTNFVMIETGQPLHAFDLRKLQSGGVRVGECRAAMPFTLLTGQTVQLEPGDILILDGDRPVALAGIMGGENSQISDDTSSIVLESAVFPATRIRRTAKRLGLSTDSSKRFEKGCDIRMVDLASERAAILLRDTFNANVYHPPIDTNETPSTDKSIALDMRDVRKVIGIPDLTTEGVMELFDSIGISTVRKSTNVLTVKVPTFRPDIRESVDLIEEVVRLNGYAAVPLNYPLSFAMYDRFDEGTFEFEQKARTALVGLGFRETIHYSFTSEDTLGRYGFLHENQVQLKNPISEEMKILRTSLLPSLCETYRFNKNRKATNIRIFEVSRSFLSDAREETGVKETALVSGLMSGQATPAFWTKTDEPLDYFHAKGVAEALVRQLTTVRLSYEPPTNSRLIHPNRGAVIKIGHREVGLVGELHPHILNNVMETDESVVVFELNLEALKRFEKNNIRFKPPSKYPSVEVDVALLVDKSVTAQTITDTITGTVKGLLTRTDVFDVYEGSNIPEDKKSVAVRMTFVSTERTLLDGEVNEAKGLITKALSEKLGAQLRA